jgi:hypothetical protein
MPPKRKVTQEKNEEIEENHAAKKTKRTVVIEHCKSW